MDNKIYTKKRREMTRKRGNLDAVRGIGIAGIVLYHLFPERFRGGFLGVLLFFVISGYLMFLTAQCSWEKGNFRIGNYYKKRVKKIFPPLFCMVMATCCYLTIAKSSHLAGIRQEICSIFLGYNNWWQIHQNASYFSKLTCASPFTHLWFLSVEMQCYLLWPFLFLLYQKGAQLIGGRKMCFSFLFLALLSAGRMFCLYVPGSDPSRVYYGTDTMAFSLFLGMFLGALRQEYPELCAPCRNRKIRSAPVFSCFLLILTQLFVLVDGRWHVLYQGGMLLLSLFFAGTVHLIESGYGAEDISHYVPFLSYPGKKSYGIYLWHYPIIILALIN